MFFQLQNENDLYNNLKLNVKRLYNNHKLNVQDFMIISNLMCKIQYLCCCQQL